MKSANKLAENEIRANIPHEAAIDPFAVDFFGAKPSAAEESNKTRENFFNYRKVGKPAKKSDWHKKLAKISINEAEFSDAIQNLPDDLSGEITKAISQMIARYTFRQSEKVACSIISIAEKNINRSLKNLAKTPQIFFTISGVADNSIALLTLNTQFAATVIDVILGSQTDENAAQRDLSPIEITITEFMVATILSEINRFLGNSLLTLQTVETTPAQIFESEERGVEMVFLIEIDGFSGILTAFLPKKFFSQFENSPNPLFVKDLKKKRLVNLERIARAIDLNIQIGTTTLDANSLLYLEADDIVLVENPEISLDKGLLSNNLQMYVGRGRNFRLLGNAETKEFNGEMFFKIREILSEETRRKFTPMRLKMEEKETTTDEKTPEIENNSAEKTEDLTAQQLSPTLENVQVALRVQIAADKITLRELQNLHSGQIIALGCRPNDPVRLVTDNNEEPVAMGELIEIEGHLGVRLTKVFI